MLHVAFPVVAQAQPTAAQTGSAVLIFVAIAVPILMLIVAIVGLYVSSRRMPPIAEEMHKVFIPRKDHDEDVQRIHGRIDKVSEDVITSRTQFAKAFGDLEHAIGRLEGRLDATEDRR